MTASDDGFHPQADQLDIPGSFFFYTNHPVCPETTSLALWMCFL
jgi:hypothetical protein